MNLSVSPVSYFNHSNQVAQNKNQNFGLNVCLKNPIPGACRTQDVILDQFVGEFQKAAKEIHFNEAKFDKKGFFVEFVEDKIFGLNGILKDAKKQPVSDEVGQIQAFAHGYDADNAKNFATRLKNAGLDA